MLTVVELVVGLFTGRLGEAWASTRAFVGLLPRTPALLARRRAIASRRVDDAEILDLQNRGSARLTSYRRARDTETYIGTDANVRRWRESSLGVTIAWIVVVVGIIVASRTMIDTAVPSIGELRPLPDSARQWWSDFVSGWNPAGLGGTVANPTGLGRAVDRQRAVAVPDGPRPDRARRRARSSSACWGTWRLATLYPSNRARIAALLVYAAIPLVPGVISTGRLTALVAYAAVPWFVHLLRVAVGIGTADPAPAADDLVDGIIGLSRPRAGPAHGAAGDRHRARRGPGARRAPRRRGRRRRPRADHASPPAPAGGPRRGSPASAWPPRSLAWLLNLPWSPTWSWDDLAAPQLAGPTGRGVVDVATMAIGQARLEVAGAGALRARPRRPRRRPGVAPDVGGARRRPDRRVPRARRAAGPRRPAGSPCPTSACCSCRSALGLALGGGVGRRRVRRGRRRADVRLAPAGRPAGRRRRRRRPVPGAAHDRRRRLVRARHQPRRVRRDVARAARRRRRLPRPVPR